MTADLDKIAAELVPAVERLVGHSPQDTCVLIGHSMGGLVAAPVRAGTRRRPPGRYRGDAGTPHRGPITRTGGVGRALEQCRPGSAHLQRLDQTARPGLARWIAYCSDLDFMITPALSAKLQHPAMNATNVRVRDTGHLSLLLSRSVLADLIQPRTGRARGGGEAWG